MVLFAWACDWLPAAPPVTSRSVAPARVALGDAARPRMRAPRLLLATVEVFRSARTSRTASTRHLRRSYARASMLGHPGVGALGDRGAAALVVVPTALASNRVL